MKLSTAFVCYVFEWLSICFGKLMWQRCRWITFLHKFLFAFAFIRTSNVHICSEIHLACLQKQLTLPADHAAIAAAETTYITHHVHDSYTWFGLGWDSHLDWGQTQTPIAFCSHTHLLSHSHTDTHVAWWDDTTLSINTRVGHILLISILLLPYQLLLHTILNKPHTTHQESAVREPGKASVAYGAGIKSHFVRFNTPGKDRNTWYTHTHTVHERLYRGHTPRIHWHKGGTTT